MESPIFYFHLLGGLPTATYSQNVGIVATTKVINRCVLGGAALILLSRRTDSESSRLF